MFNTIGIKDIEENSERKCVKPHEVLRDVEGGNDNKHWDVSNDQY